MQINALAYAVMHGLWRSATEKSGCAAVLGTQYNFSLDIIGATNSETPNQLGIYLENLNDGNSQHIPLSGSNIRTSKCESWKNLICLYLADIQLNYLSPNTTYKYRTYVIVNNKIFYSENEKAQTFKTGESICPDSNHPHMIDLGLPSGTKWACCNVGASKPEDKGGYYAWGEANTKSYYGLSTYQFATEVDNGWYDERTNKRYTYINIGTDIAGTGYDAATVNWGSPWKMPNQTQIDELIHKCMGGWGGKLNGVSGLMFIGPNRNKIFLPVAGYRYKSGIYYDDPYHGFYWSSQLSSYFTSACDIYFSGGGTSWYFFDYIWRDAGLLVRPVCQN